MSDQPQVLSGASRAAGYEEAVAPAELPPAQVHESSAVPMPQEAVPQPGPQAAAPVPLPYDSMRQAMPPAAVAVPAPYVVDPQMHAAGRESLAGPARAPGVYATWGKRGRVRRLSAGLIKPAPSREEAGYLEAVRVIRQATWTRPVRILVANPKGGAGKTPIALGLGSALSSVRGGMVVTWEVGEIAGSLSRRAEGQPPRGLGEMLDGIDSLSSAGSVGGFTQPQTSHLDVVGSIAQRGVLGDADVRAVGEVLDRYYRIAVMDSGNNFHAPCFEQAVDVADLLVVPVPWSSADAAHLALDLLDALRERSEAGRVLADHAIIVTTHDGRMEAREMSARIRGALEAETRGLRPIVDIPYDAHIAQGTEIVWSALAQPTRTAFTHLGATVASGLLATVR